MARILITSGPTRQYLDPVRYLTNASSGRMGRALAEAALDLGHRVTIVSGPVTLDYPAAATVIPVVSTEDMLEACGRVFLDHDGLIATAAPCDYRPKKVQSQKIAKTGQPLELLLIETPDIVATLAATKRPEQWLVGFALETHDRHFRAMIKAEKKSCDLMVLNGPEAMNSLTNHIEILDRRGRILNTFAGTKEDVARAIMQVVQDRLISP